MKEIKDYYENNKKFCITAALLALLIVTMLLSFNFKGHDYEFHIQRMGSIAEEIRFKGLAAFPNRIFSTNLHGYGYANPIFYGDILLYPFAFLMLLGVNGVYACRILNVCLYVFCFSSTFWCLKQTLKDTESSFIGAILYTFSAYFTVDVFVRNAMGESFAYAFLPFLTYGFYCTLINRAMPKKHRLFLVLGMSGIILSHLISTVMVSAALVIMFFVYYKKWIKNTEIIKDLVCLVLLTVAICAFFVFPLLEQITYSEFSVTTLINTFDSEYWRMHIASWIGPHAFWKLQNATFPELANSPWFPGGFGYVLIALLTIWLINVKKIKFTMPCALIIAAVFLILTANNLLIPLQILKPVFSFMQFPYRVLLLATLFMSIFGVYIVYKLKNKKVNWVLLITVIISCMVVIFSGYRIIKKEIPNMNELYTFGTDSLGNAEYIPKEMFDALPDKNYSKYTSERGNRIDKNYKDIIIENQTNDGHGTVEFDFSANRYSDAAFEMPLIYYKGYSAKDTETGEKYEVSVSNNGLVNVNVGATEAGSVKVKYTGTPIQHISDIISLVSILGLLIYIIKPEWLAIIKEKLLSVRFVKNGQKD